MAKTTVIEIESQTFTKYYDQFRQGGEKSIHCFLGIAPNQKIRLTGNTRLINLDFTGADLHNVDFTGSNLSQSNFTNANLSGANLTNTILQHVTLDNTLVAGTIFEGTDLSHSLIKSVDLSHKNFSGVCLDASTMESVNCNCATFNNASLIKVVFENSKLNFAEFSKTNLAYTNFGNSEVSKTTFSDSSFNHTIFVAVKDPRKEITKNRLGYNIITTRQELSNLVNRVDSDINDSLKRHYARALLASAAQEEDKETQQFYKESALVCLKKLDEISRQNIKDWYQEKPKDTLQDNHQRTDAEDAQKIALVQEILIQTLPGTHAEKYRNKTSSTNTNVVIKF